MTQSCKPNRAQRQRMLYGTLPAGDGIRTGMGPMDKAVSLRHKKPWQKKAENKALAEHGLKPRHKDI